MPLSIPNTTVGSSSYTAALTFAGNDVFAWGFFTVANNPVFAQLLEGPHGQAVPQDEVYLPPATYPIAGGDRAISGIRFRANDATVTPLPQVFGTLYYPREPGVQAGTPFPGNISPSGGLTGVAGVLGYQEFTAAVATAAATEAAPLTVAALPSIDFDGATPVVFEFFCPAMTYPVAGNFGVNLWDLTNVIDQGRLLASPAVTSASGFLAGAVPDPAIRRFTPSAGSRIYGARMWRTAGTYTLNAGVGGVGTYFPGYLLARTDPNA